MPSVHRILDANANRAREALRVMEEAARFLLDDVALCGDLKQLRHDLAEGLMAVEGLEASRNTPADVGTTIRTDRESTRRSVAHVAVAAGKRLSESLRAIEEYGKVLGDSIRVAGGTPFAAVFEQLRYRGYEIEMRLNLALSATAPKQWKLCVLITESLCTHHGWVEVMRAAVEGGADCIQLREKSLDDRELLLRAAAAVEMARPRGVSVVVNDRADVAVAAGADGVHLGQEDLECRMVRRLFGHQLLIGVSTSGIEQAREAFAQGADYGAVGPMCKTTTKQKDKIAGPAYLEQYLQWGRMPHLAIGGITPGNLPELVGVGCRGVAVSSCVCGAADPAVVIHQLGEALEGSVVTK